MLYFLILCLLKFIDIIYFIVLNKFFEILLYKKSYIACKFFDLL